MNGVLNFTFRECVNLSAKGAKKSGQVLAFPISCFFGSGYVSNAQVNSIFPHEVSPSYYLEFRHSFIRDVGWELKP